MTFGEQCSTKLEELVVGFKRSDDIYFTLNEIKKLPRLIERLRNVDTIIITPYQITDISITEIYWCELIIEIVDTPQNKFIALLSEAGKTTLEEVDPESVEQWDYTHYQIRDEQKSMIDSLKRYISYMEKREIVLREEYDTINDKEQGIYYKVW